MEKAPVAKMLKMFLESVEKMRDDEYLPFTESERKILTQAGYDIETESLATKDDYEDDGEEYYDGSLAHMVSKEPSKKFPGKKVYVLTPGMSKHVLSQPFHGEENLPELKKLVSGIQEEKKMTPQEYAAFRKQRDAGKVDPTRKKGLKENTVDDFVVVSKIPDNSVGREQRIKNWDKAFAYFGDKIISLPDGGKITLYGYLDGEFINIEATKGEE